MEVIVGSDFPKKIIPLFDKAKRNIDIVVYDWRWYQDNPEHAVQQFNAALVRARQRGVMVRAVINTPELIPILTKCGIGARCTRDKRTLHAKMIIVDGEKLVIGSHNFTKNAFGSNLEVSIITEILPENTRLAELYENLYNI
jgi:phosphatidylserine/phosphatidylglycerophosphate/cardiolipin synthase-like enzyme